MLLNYIKMRQCSREICLNFLSALLDNGECEGTLELLDQNGFSLTFINFIPVC